MEKQEDYDQGIRRLERSYKSKNVNTSEDSESQFIKGKKPIVMQSSAVTEALSTSRPLFKKKTLRQIKEKVCMPEEDDDSLDEENSGNDDCEITDGKTLESGTPSRPNSNKDSADLSEVVTDLKKFFQSEMYKMKRSIMYELKQSLDEIKAIAATQRSSDDSNRPHYCQVFGTDLPFNDIHKFLEFEMSLISDDSKQNALKDVFRLATVGSNNYINDVASIIKKIITKAVQLEYSGCGRKVLGTGKRSFKDTQVFKFMSGPGYATPLEAMKGPREDLLYVVCVQPNHSEGKSDLLATIDVDPKSSTYCKIIHRLHTGNPNDELHHSGWNTCSSCHTTKGCHAQPKRDTLVLPSITSNRIYFVNTGLNPKAPEISKVIEPSKMTDLNCAYPHTTHCLASGEIMISVLGDKNGNAKGDFVLIDGKTLEITGTWTNGKVAKYGYDFWYQPYFDVLVASEWAVPNVFKNGFIPKDALNPDIYGTSLNFYSWKSRELIQTIDLGSDGVAPLEIRFLHNPKESQGFVGCCLNSNIYRFYLDDGIWKTEKVISVKPKRVSGWISDYIQGTISDILISLDDKYLYFSNWVHGDVRQYDISDRRNPKLTGQVFLGGKIVSDSKIKVLEDPELDFVPDPVYIKGKRLYGAPQMLQLSLDGKRLYVSSSLFSPWDRQFYPESIEHGSFLVKLDVDVENGGMKLDKNFYVDFETGPDGPLLAHEMRYPGGDCTSDIWMVDESK